MQVFFLMCTADASVGDAFRFLVAVVVFDSKMVVEVCDVVEAFAIAAIADTANDAIVGPTSKCSLRYMIALLC